MIEMRWKKLNPRNDNLTNAIRTKKEVEWEDGTGFSILPTYLQLQYIDHDVLIPEWKDVKIDEN
jgi:hypothetical protein